ncbi:hypothetical protein ACIRRH_39460 [Kitasatospora sp. NPDC101235]|uniref:hypothetical protein n=1 Tax=Kitasatospora sp. NPDC101235 TaxID=3364101 RepID=UPI003830C98F
MRSTPRRIVRLLVVHVCAVFQALVLGSPDGRCIGCGSAARTSSTRTAHGSRLCGLPAWDPVVIDEAHRTAGAEGTEWAAIRNDDQVPAERRPYFTATLRITDGRKAEDGLADLGADADGQAPPAMCSAGCGQVAVSTAPTT